MLWNIVVVAAGFLLFCGAARAGEDKREWKDGDGREWKSQLKSETGESTEEWKDGRGREWKREMKPQTGEWKETWKDGRCSIERSVDGNGRFLEKRDC